MPCTRATGRPVNEDNIRHLVDEQLRPLGLLVAKDGSQPRRRSETPCWACDSAM